MSSKDTPSVSIERVIADIEKQHGKGAIMRLGNKKFPPVEVIPTSSLALDYALGVGGYPRGRVIETFGPESSGKTTLTLHAIAETQKLGGKAAFIDAEHAIDPDYARKLNVDVDDLYIAQPDSGEQALEITESLIKSGKFDIVVVDSVAALVPRAELEGDMGAPQMGLQARMMSQALRKLTGVTNKTKTVLMFINQIREKIGVMFGSPEVTTGGRALKFFASVRLDIRKTGLLKDGDVVIGADTKIKVVKNKCAAPFKEALVRLLYNHGISHEHDLITLGEAHNVLERSGSWFSYQGERIGQGGDNARVFLVEHPETAQKIETALREILFKKG